MSSSCEYEELVVLFVLVPLFTPPMCIVKGNSLLAA